jgi:hypothetical protein
MTLEVIVDDRRFGLQRCQTRDVSLEGLFVETKHSPLRKRAMVDLVLKIPVNDKTKRHRVQARVANTRKDGARLIFRNLHEKAYTALVDLLYPPE